MMASPQRIDSRTTFSRAFRHDLPEIPSDWMILQKFPFTLKKSDCHSFSPLESIRRKGIRVVWVKVCNRLATSGFSLNLFNKGCLILPLYPQKSLCLSRSGSGFTAVGIGPNIFRKYWSHWSSSNHGLHFSMHPRSMKEFDSKLHPA